MAISVELPIYVLKLLLRPFQLHGFLKLSILHCAYAVKGFIIIAEHDLEREIEFSSLFQNLIYYEDMVYGWISPCKACLIYWLLGEVYK